MLNPANVLHNATEHTGIMEPFENGDKDKDYWCSSTIKNGEYKVRFMIDFSNRLLFFIYYQKWWVWGKIYGWIFKQ